MKNHILFSFLGAIILFIWSFLSWAAINLHQDEQTYTPLEKDVLSAITETGLEPGMYALGQGDPTGGHEAQWVEWESDLYWYLGDTLGYIVTQYLNDEAIYVSVDTSYMIGFDGMEVPTSNVISYSNSYGELNNMIAPVKSMIGDTLTLTAFWYEGEQSFGIVLD